jgi:t-SNARE complex subunit (syntaxin)
MSGKILKGREIKGICAGRYHSVVYTNNAVFTCGLNAGQLGKICCFSILVAVIVVVVGFTTTYSVSAYHH